MRSAASYNRLRSTGGQALAEFLVVVPLLLLLLMATVGFGHLIFTKMVVVQAANRAARLGSVLFGDSTVSTSEARKQTREAALSTLSTALNGDDREVTVTEVGDDLKVTVRYRSTVFVPLLRPWLGSEFSVEHESVYRVERDTP
ncbi:MAG: TadE/TadG family type IV pilus assembly protein [Bacillota bacterium]